jgi:hypothetical protein
MLRPNDQWLTISLYRTSFRRFVNPCVDFGLFEPSMNTVRLRLCSRLT